MSQSNKSPKRIEDTKGWKEWKKKSDRQAENIRRLNLTHDQLIELAASMAVTEEETHKINQELIAELNSAETFLNIMRANTSKISDELKLSLADLFSTTRSVTYQAFSHGMTLSKKINAKRGGMARVKNDPKQKAKGVARKLWEDWQSGKALYKSGAAFARHVVSVLPEIESEKTIERWEREWRKDTKKQALS